MKDNSEVRRTAKSALYIALDLTENAIDGLPIPGAKGIFSGVISMLKQVDTTNSNAETLDVLQKHVDYLRLEALGPLSGKNEAGIHPELKEDVEGLASELQTLIKPWVKRKRRKRIMRFITADEDKGDLRTLADDIGRAVERFQVLQLRRIREHQLSEQDSRFVENLTRAKDASFDSNRTRKIRSCLEGTRSELLQKISAWVESEDANEPRIFWLNGMAGLGKSTIARSVAEWAKNSDILGANFFFAHDVQDLHNAALLFPTLAYQLAKFDAGYERQLAKVLSEEADLDHREFATQFERLILEPLLASHQPSEPRRTILVVLDAIDECAPETSVREFLRILLTKSSAIPQKFLVFLTSRPEPHIQSAFAPRINNTKAAGFVLHDVEDSVVQRDIETYLRVEFHRVPEEELGLEIENGWPGEEDIKMLAGRCGRFFVYAATALRYVFDERDRSPRKHLNLLLAEKGCQETSVNPYSALDQLYMDVLSSAVSIRDGDESVGRRIRTVLGAVVVLRNILPFPDFAALLHLGEDEILSSLYHLHSIVVFQSHNSISSSPRFFHPSFPDFITDVHRCTDERFWVDTKLDEARLCEECLDIMMNTLIRDPLKLAVNGRNAREIPQDEVDAMANMAFPPLLRYACEFWSAHLLEGSFEKTPVLLEKLRRFADSFLLHWLEATTWLGLADKVVISTREVSILLRDVDEGLSSTLYDVHRFILYNRFLFVQDPSEVYKSALAFVPHDTQLCRMYDNFNLDSVRVLRGVDVSWPLLVTFLPHADEVTCIAYANDGKRIATGTRSGSITIWDAQSGAPKLYIAGGEHHAVRHIRFSNDHSVIASTNVVGSNIVVWDALSGVKQKTLEGHSDIVNGLDFKPSPTVDHILASASQDTSIRIWDVVSGRSLLQVPVLDPVSLSAVPVRSIAFHPSGDRMFSTSDDQTIRLWHSVSGSQMWCYSHPKHIIPEAILIKNDCIIFGDEDSNLFTMISTTDNPPTKMLSCGGQKIRCIFPSGVEDGLAVSIEDFGLHMFDIGKQEVYESVPYPTACVNHVAYRYPGLTAISIEGERTCALWDSAWRLETVDYGDHRGEVTSLALSDDASMLASGGGDDDCTVRIWSASNGQHLDTLEGHTNAVR
ncbi:WD40 repeat-like protein [Schizopora paradoxa]|uniref:WD40 repeat-like protein n=1 Tax=Schizopora paradoxa TaxID=27342 RepID=A0A0H2RUM6_9AGAM|nr:WD40 repeat-like protein [Schizopora paradoxa]